MLWRARHFEFRFPRPTLVMGIVNVTPDSFSDGGRYFDPEAAVRHAHELVRQGADLLDIGGESTRPGAQPVEEDEEMRRVLPVVRRLAHELTVPISIDTSKPRVAAAAVDAGASIVNNIASHRTDRAMTELLAGSGVGYIAMHMRGEPRTMQSDPQYTDVVAEVRAFFVEVRDRLLDAGVEATRIAFDPGIGFGKTLEHNLELLAHTQAFRDLGRPLLIGVSRKSFVGALTGAEVNERLPGSIAATCAVVQDGVAIVRTHDVRETAQALRVTEAILARRSVQE